MKPLLGALFPNSQVLKICTISWMWREMVAHSKEWGGEADHNEDGCLLSGWTRTYVLEEDKWKCMSCSLVQRIVFQVTDLAELAQLSLVDKCCAWEAPWHEVDKGLRCSFIQLEEVTKRGLVAAVNSVNFPASQIEARVTWEEDWKSKNLLKDNCSSRVPSVATRDTRRSNCKFCLLVTQNSSKQVRKISLIWSDNSYKLCLVWWGCFLTIN